MRGIATIERVPDDSTVAVWVTNRTSPLAATHTNAVVIQADDLSASIKVYSLTRCCAILLTDGSDLTGLSVEGEPLQRLDVDEMLKEIRGHQQRIAEALADYKRKSSSGLVPPSFPSAPRYAPPPAASKPGDSAFALANYLASAWTAWLKTDEERRRRTVQPKTGKTPWIMPAEMNDAGIPALPPQFTSRVHEQPMV